MACDSGVYLGYRLKRNKSGGDERHGKVIFQGDEHLTLIGPTRSGKGRRILIPNLISDTERSTVVIDPKGELYAATAAHRKRNGHEIKLIDPFHVTGMVDHGYNPLLSLSPASSSFIDDATALAEALVIIEGHDTHWTASAQDLVAGMIMYECLQWLQNPLYVPSMRRIREIICYPSNRFGEFIEGMLQVCQNIGNDNADMTINKLHKYQAAESSRELSSVISTAQTQTRLLDSPPIANSLDGSGFNFERMKCEKITTYLVLPPSRIATHAKWLRMLVGAAMRDMQTTPERKDRPAVMFMLDEFAQLGHMQVVETAVSLNAGYGVKVLSVIQNLGQLQNLYKDSWETFISAGVVVSFAPRDYLTSEYLSKLAGQEWVDVASSSSGVQGGSHSVTQQLVPAYLPEHFRIMPRGELILFLPTDEGQAMWRATAPDFSETEIASYVR